ncbi:MAG: alanine--tRNA ligase [Candidatus Andersenbacteria bacterium]
MRSDEIRSSFLEFFKQRDHTVAPSSSLVSKDPTVLLTTAGMQQFTPYFIGDQDAPHARYTSVQKCFRTPDIEEVGDESHNTFFEMLGNFSIGDYFKADAIPWAWEYATQVLKLPADKLYVTIFKGEPARNGQPAIAEDDEARQVWLQVGVPEERIRAFGRDSNFWGPPGESGPCGPSSEIHIDRGAEHSTRPNDGHECGPNCDCGRFLELWNLVFMQYFQAEDGALSPLPAKNIDTGAGLERLALVLQNKTSVYDTDLFTPLLDKVAELTGKRYDDDRRAFRIVADHVRGATFLIADGVRPGKNGRDYILRRIIRRAVRQGERLGLHEPFVATLAAVVVEQYAHHYTELRQHAAAIAAELSTEEAAFRKTLARGLKLFEQATATGTLTGEQAFDLYQSYGFPIEMVRELATERELKFDEAGYEKAFAAHQELSRVGAMEKFKRKGGGQGDEVKKAHTATHLLHQALRDVLGPTVKQAGSRLFDDELSFDFTYGSKLTDEQRARVEQIVNDKIKAGLPMVMEVVPIDEAKKRGAIGLFESKYGDKVQVCSIVEGGKPYSLEFCGGPHVDNTATVQAFKITKEKSSSAGIRRIKAVVGRKAAA